MLARRRRPHDRIPCSALDPRYEPPGAGVLRHGAHRRLLLQRARVPAGEDRRAARRHGAALLLRHRQRRRADAGVLLVPERPRGHAGRDAHLRATSPRAVRVGGQLDEPRRLRRAARGDRGAAQAADGGRRRVHADRQPRRQPDGRRAARCTPACSCAPSTSATPTTSRWSWRRGPRCSTSPT